MVAATSMSAQDVNNHIGQGNENRQLRRSVVIRVSYLLGGEGGRCDGCDRLGGWR